MTRFGDYLRDNGYRLAGRIYLLIGFIFLLLPIAFLIMFSFQENPYLSFPLRGWSMRWYDKLVDDGVLFDALLNSLYVSPIAATGASVIGFLAAYALNRFIFPGRLVMATILILPILIPPLILGVALLGLLSRIGLHGELYSVILTHTLILTAPAMAIIQLRLAQMPTALEEAAWDLGATELQTVWRVVLPWALPGIAGGWLLAFTFSFDEFIIAWFVSGFDSTLPVAIYNVMIAMHDPSLTAIGTIVFGLLLFALLGAELLIIPLFIKHRSTS